MKNKEHLIYPTVILFCLLLGLSIILPSPNTNVDNTITAYAPHTLKMNKVFVDFSRPFMAKCFLEYDYPSDVVYTNVIKDCANLFLTQHYLNTEKVYMEFNKADIWSNG